MGFMEMVQAAYTVDLGFFAGIVANNLLWVFVFISAGYVFTDGKHAIRNALIYVFLVTTSMDLFTLMKFSIYTAFGLGLLYIIRVPLLLFLEKSDGGAKYIPLAWAATFFFVIGLVAFSV